MDQATQKWTLLFPFISHPIHSTPMIPYNQLFNSHQTILKQLAYNQTAPDQRVFNLILHSNQTAIYLPSLKPTSSDTIVSYHIQTINVMVFFFKVSLSSVSSILRPIINQSINKVGIHLMRQHLQVFFQTINQSIHLMLCHFSHQYLRLIRMHYLDILLKQLLRMKQLIIILRLAWCSKLCWILYLHCLLLHRYIHRFRLTKN